MRRMHRLRCRLLGHGPFRHESDFSDPLPARSRLEVRHETLVRCLACMQILRIPYLLASDLAASDDSAIRESIERFRSATVATATSEQARPGWINRLRRWWR